MEKATAGKGGDRNAIKSFLFPFDSLASRVHATLFFHFRYSSLAVATVLYAAVVLLFGNSLAVSSNYFVLAPVMVASLGFGTVGGLIAGALALPVNLLLFGFLGHPEYSPASKLLAELSGVVVGLVSGRLADYFRLLEREIIKRTETEEALRAALAEKKLLLSELHHRVKNNLSVIKSLVQLQRNRSKDPAFLEAADELIGRIFAISLVHDQLDVSQSLAVVQVDKFMEALVGNIEGGLGLEDSRISLDLDTEGRFIQIEAATSLGLIVNEALTNSLKHAARGQGARGPDGKPSIRLSLRVEQFDDGPWYRLVILDDGPGPAAKRGAEASGGLGMKLVRALARNLGGRTMLETVQRSGVDGPAGARFELLFPDAFMELV